MSQKENTERSTFVIYFCCFKSQPVSASSKVGLGAQCLDGERGAFLNCISEQRSGHRAVSSPSIHPSVHASLVQLCAPQAESKGVGRASNGGARGWWRVWRLVGVSAQGQELHSHLCGSLPAQDVLFFLSWGFYFVGHWLD